MAAKEPAALPTAGPVPVVQQEPQPKQYGGDAAMATGADAPPGYSKVLKEQPAVLAYQGAFVQPVQYMDTGAIAANKYRSSHDYLIFSAITFIICGIFNFLTLSCSIPAVILSYQSRENRLRGSYRTANDFSSCALALSVTAIVSGLIVFIVVVGIAFIFYFHPCTLGLNFTICNT